MDGTSPPAANPAELTAALDGLFRRYDRWLRSMLRKRYGAEFADDVAQETYLRAAPYQVANEIRHPKAFLMRIADNLARDRLRRERHEVNQDEGRAALDRQSLSATQDHALTLKQIVLALPPKLRDVFVLGHIEGLTYDEIAPLLGISVHAVQHRMRQALEKTSSAMRD